VNIELIAVGDELLLGTTLDRNSNWIASRLTENGLRLRWHETVGDNESDIRHQLRRAWNRAEVVLLTGGLGPTHDDITRPVLTRFFEDDLLFRDDLMEPIRERFRARGLDIPPGTEVMAEFPVRAHPIPNLHGSAPGIHYHEDQKQLFAMPGVPVEMRGMMESYVLPSLMEYRQDHYGFRTIKTTGRGESHLAALIGDPLLLKPVELAFLPSIDYGVTLRISATADSKQQVNAVLDQAEEFLKQRIGGFIYSFSGKLLETVILDVMRQRGLKLAVAESCTGGIISSRIISIPGSSDVFERGFITYSDGSKTDLLGVDPAIIATQGAVSGDVAQAMADGARQRSGADIAMAVTGIAGPSGGTSEKPVGLVYIGLSDREHSETHRFQFTGDRDTNRRRAAQAALNLLWMRLQETRNG